MFGTSSSLFGLELPVPGAGPMPARLKRGRSRSIRLRWVDGVLEVTTPTGRLSQADWARVCQVHQAWFHRHGGAMQALLGQRQAYLATAHQQVTWLGQPRQLQFSRGSRFHVEHCGTSIHISHNPAKGVTLALLGQLALRKLAAKHLPLRTDHWADAMGLHPTALRIKDQRRRWGSCSSQGTVNLNWHLAMLPPNLADAVVVHELAHLRHLNHGPDFWRLVAQYDPDYQAHRQALKTHSWVLGVYDALAT